MGISLIETISTLFLKEKTHQLSLQKIYEQIKNDYPDKDKIQLKHSIRRSIQTLYSRGTITPYGAGLYVLKE